jgi:hypothetical protein
MCVLPLFHAQTTVNVWVKHALQEHASSILSALTTVNATGNYARDIASQGVAWTTVCVQQERHV